MGSIIFLQEVYETRKQKQRELDYYKQQMSMLVERMNLVQKEINVTDAIIHIIEEEIRK
jgi:hypothetical protein